MPSCEISRVYVCLREGGQGGRDYLALLVRFLADILQVAHYFTWACDTTQGVGQARSTHCTHFLCNIQTSKCFIFPSQDNSLLSVGRGTVSE